MKSSSAFRFTSQERARLLRVEYIVVALLAFAVLFGTIKRVDIVVRAPGIIVTQDGSRTLKPKRSGVVEKFHVQEGDFVNEGDLLVSMSDAELDVILVGVTEQLERVKIEIFFTSAMLDDIDANELEERLKDQSFLPSADLTKWKNFFNAQKDLAETQRILNVEQITKFEIDRDLSTSKELRLSAIVNDYNERYKAIEELHSNGSLSRIDFVESKIELARLKENKFVERDNSEKINQQIQNFKAKVDWELSQNKASNREKLLELEGEKARLEIDYDRLIEQIADLKIHATISGIVQEPAIELLQQRVSNNPLLVLVSKEETLEVLARLRSSDIAFVSIGQSAKLLMEAYSMVRFGTIDATIKSVTLDTAKGEAQIPVPVEITEVRRLQPDILQTQNQPTYIVRLSVENYQNGIQLRPGLSSIVNIKTGERRLITFFLDPFLRAWFSAVKER